MPQIKTLSSLIPNGLEQVDYLDFIAPEDLREAQIELSRIEEIEAELKLSN